VPEVRAAGWFGFGPDRGLEIDALQRLGLVPAPDLIEADPPAGPVGDRRGPGDGQRIVASLAVQDRARRVAQLRMIGQDLDPDRTAQTVDAPNEGDDQTFVGDRPSAG
jgi:hypothetical protein